MVYHMTNFPESARQLLNGPGLQAILKRVALHDELLRIVKTGLPPTTAKHCVHCVVREDGALLLYTDSQAFATQFRFHAPAIQAKLNTADKLFIKQIVVRNLKHAVSTAPDKTLPPIPKPSLNTIKAVKASGKERLAGDELGESLQRLASSMERYAANKKP
jgi:hypothetical protein